MKRQKIILGVLILLILFSKVYSYEFEWKKLTYEQAHVQAIYLDPYNYRSIYIGSKNSLYFTSDDGKSWQRIFSISANNGSINFIYPAGNNLFLGTSQGLYLSYDKGRKFQRVFMGKNSWENNCKHIVVLDKIILLGTENGLFISDNNGKTWHKVQGKLSTGRILCLGYGFRNPSLVYVLSVNGLFISKDAGRSFSLIKTDFSYEDENVDSEYLDSDEEKDRKVSSFRYISVDPQNSCRIVLSTNKGVFESKDCAQNWQRLSPIGLLNEDIDYVFFSSDSDIFAVNKSGIFIYQNDSWKELSLRLPVNKVYCLAYRGGFLYAGTNLGLYKLNLKQRVLSEEPSLTLLKDLPDIRKVQEQAIKYAEVEPEKIKIWRRQAMKRALLPRLSVSFDFDRNRTVSDNFYTYGGKWYILPSDTTTYKNHNWGISLSWELGDLIWNDAQVSIDVRSRLNTQLRNEILDEVTRLYYEWIRLKIELKNLSVEDKKKIIEKKIKIEEIVSLLDAYTGGYFSKNLKP